MVRVIERWCNPCGGWTYDGCELCGRCACECECYDSAPEVAEPIQ